MVRAEPRAGAAWAWAGLGASGALPLSHEALDQLAPDKCVEHLRAVLVAARVLPARDEHLARLEAWLNTTIAGIGDSADRHLLRRYTTWHHLRRLRRRAAAGGVTYEQSQTLRHRTQAAIDFLAVLAAHDRTLATCRQADLDQWLIDNQVPEPGALGTFIRWAKSHKVTTLDLPAQRWQGPQGPVDQDQRWGIARRLLHDASIHPADRVAGLLVVLYAQTAGHVSRLKVDHLIAEDGHVRIRLGATPVDLPEPLATLARGLIADRPATGQAASPWLSPAAHPAAPSAPPSCCDASLGSASTPSPLAPRRCANWPPNFPPPSCPQPGHRHQHRGQVAARRRRRLDRLRRRAQPT